VTDPSQLRVVTRHPFPGAQHAPLLVSIELLLEQAAECLPVQVRVSEETYVFESWEVTRAAFIARMAGTLRHMSYLAPSNSRLDGMALARTLVEHAITYAWVAADPVERLPHAEHGVELIDDRTRAIFRKYVRTHRTDLPGLPRLAAEANDAWRDSITRQGSPLHTPDFEELYRTVYDNYAGVDHASTLGLVTFVHVSADQRVATVDGDAVRRQGDDLRPYWTGLFALAEALVVSNLMSGRPRTGPLQRALKEIGTVRGLEQQGRLTVEQSEDGSLTLRIRADTDA
jgi:hypothetical protein